MPRWVIVALLSAFGFICPGNHNTHTHTHTHTMERREESSEGQGENVRRVGSDDDTEEEDGGQSPRLQDILAAHSRDCSGDFFDCFQGSKLTPARMPRALTFLAGQVKPTNNLPVWASSQLTIGQVGPQA